MRRKLLLILIVVILFSSESYSQFVYSVRSLGMGKTGVSNMFSLDAFNNNPANLTRERVGENSRIYIGLPTLGYSMSSRFFSVDFYNNYFTGGNERVLSEDEKFELVRSASDNPSTFNGFISWGSALWHTKAGTFGISFDDKIGGNFIPSKDFMELTVYGNERNRLYDLSESDFGFSWIRQLNISYSNRIKSSNKKEYGDFFYGFSVKPQMGFYYGQILNNNYTFYTDSVNVLSGTGGAEILTSAVMNDKDKKLRASWTPAGWGLGFDLGGSIKVKNFLGMGSFDFGLSVIDIGFVKWTENSFRTILDGNYFITNLYNREQLDSLETIIEGKRTYEEFTTMLPTHARLGFTYRLCLHKVGDNRPVDDRLEFMNFSLEYIQGFTNKSGGTTKPILATGVELVIGKVFCPRLGVTVGGREKLIFSGGLGIDTGPVVFDIATSHVQSVVYPKSSGGFSAAASIKIRIK